MTIKSIKSWITGLSVMIVLLIASIQAQAFDSMKMGDWDITISGNINGFSTNIDCDSNNNGIVSGGLACGSNGIDRDAANIQTGLLPSWFSFNGKQVTDSLTTEVMIGFQPGIDGNNATGAAGSPLDGGFGLNSENLRQVYVSFGSDWGSIKVGRDLGIFGSDAILSDMTLLGVGTVSDLAIGGGTTTLGRIGVGYLYADWKGQIQYSSPNWDGFSFNIGLMDPWGLVNLSGLSANAASFGQESDTYGIEGKATYTWGGEGSTTSGKVWAGFISQSLDTSIAGLSNEDATGFDVGGKVSFSGLEFVGYYYSGEGMGTTTFLFDGVDLGGQTRDSDGFYVQGTYTLPNAGTKFGLSVGESNLDLGSGDRAAGGVCDPLTFSATCTLLETNESIIFGVYHPLTPSLNLVLEYTQTEAEAHNGNDAEENTLALGVIIFY